MTYLVRGFADKIIRAILCSIFRVLHLLGAMTYLVRGLADKSHTLLNLSSTVLAVLHVQLLGAMTYLVRGLGIRARICSIFRPTP